MKKSTRSSFLSTMKVAMVILMSLATALRVSAFTNDDFLDMGFGYFGHIGIPTWGNGEIHAGTDSTDFNADMVNPSNFNPDQWVAAARDAGMEYYTFTARHGNGYCFWPTATTDFNIANSPALSGRDGVKEVAQSCKKYGMKLVIYLAMVDQHAFRGIVRDKLEFTNYVKAQIDELLYMYYDDIKGFWLDSSRSLSDEQMTEIREYIHRKKSDCIVMFNKTPELSDLKIRETGKNYSLPPQLTNINNVEAWEISDRIPDPKIFWFTYKDDLDPYKSDIYSNPSQVVDFYNKLAGYGANFSFNVPPGPNGLLSEMSVQYLREMAWTPRWRYVDNTNASISYSNHAWTADNGIYYRGTVKHSTAEGAYAEYTFTGTGVKFITKKDVDGGMIDIYLDGIKQDNLIADNYDLYASTHVKKYEYTIEGLENTQHTIRIVNTASQNSSSSSTKFWIDGFAYQQDLITNIDDLSPRITYAGAWNNNTDANAHNNSFKSSSGTRGDFAEMKFRGVGVSVVAKTGPDLGMVDIYLDDEKVVSGFDLYSSANVCNVPVYTNYSIDRDREHTIKIVATGTKNESSTNYKIAIDKIRFAKGATVDYSDNFENLNAFWKTINGSWSLAYDGSYRLEDDNAVRQNSYSFSDVAFINGDVSVEAKAKIITSYDGDARCIGVVARVTDENNLYRFYHSNGAWKLFKVVGGTGALLASTDYTLSDNTDYTVKLEIIGSTLKGYVNGALVCEATDTSLAGGTAGFFTYAAKASFDDAVIKEIRSHDDVEFISFLDDFGDGNATGWTTTLGSWSLVTDGSYRYQNDNTATRNSYALCDELSNIEDVSVEAKIKLITSYNKAFRAVGVVARAANAANMYRFYHHLGKMKIYKVVDGVGTLLDANDYKFKANTDYTFKLEIIGSTLKGYVNGALVCEATDTSLTQGTAGLFTYAAKASYDDIVIRSYPKTSD